MIDEIGRKSLNEGQPCSRLPTMSEDMRKSLIGSADFLALNYYTSRLIAPKEEISNEPSFENDAGIDYFVDDRWTRGKSDWLYSVPQGLHDLLIWIRDEYNNPKVLITENGFSDDGQVEDDERIEYLKRHLAAVSEAIREGCQVTGYTVWSIIDNFEWTQGYTKYFGIFSVNRTSDRKERGAKKSASFFKKLIDENSFID